MKHTERESTVLMHSQERNVHGKIFGGYLMRQAFEMGWLTAALFQKKQTLLLRVDQVLFLKPVDVGSIVKFKSKVTYSQKFNEKILMRVVTQTFLEDGSQANNFNFLFLVKNSSEFNLIKPETYDEILDYHEATRRLKFEPINL